MKSTDERVNELEDLVRALTARVVELEADGAAAPISSNPRLYYRTLSKGATTDGLGPVEVCSCCNGDGYVEPTGEYEALFEVNGKTVRSCPVCYGAGSTRKRLTRNELRAMGDSV